MINRISAPEIVDAVNFDVALPPYSHFVLDNGIDVFTLYGGAQEVTMIEIVFDAGNWYEDKKCVAVATNYLLKCGTRGRSAGEINELFEQHGTYLTMSCQNETASMKLFSLSRHLPTLLSLIKEIITDSVFPQDELNIYCRNQKQKLQVNLKKCDFVANRLIDTLIYGEGHPFGRYSNLTDYDNLSREDVVRFYEDQYLIGIKSIFIAGKPTADIEQLVNANFGHLNRRVGGTAMPLIDIKPDIIKKHSINNNPDGVQAAIRLGFQLPIGMEEPDYMDLKVLNFIFGGYFGSRLMANIREDKGYTYGIHAYFQERKHGISWMVSTEAGRDVSLATIEETYKEMEALRNKPVDEEELNLVKNCMIGQMLGDLDGPFQAMSKWKKYKLLGLSDGYYNNIINKIKNITSAELQETAVKYLNPDSFYEVMVV